MIREFYYAIYDEASGCWGIYNSVVDPSICHVLFARIEDAEKHASELNKKRWLASV